MAKPNFQWSKVEPTDCNDYLLATTNTKGGDAELWHVRLAPYAGTHTWLRIPGSIKFDLSDRIIIGWLVMPYFPYHMMGASVKAPTYDGRCKCVKCGKYHWIHSDC